MQVTLNKVFPLDGSVDNAWLMLRDIEQVAVCMPGAEITETIDENNYKGSVKVKIGPMNMAFNGDISVKDINADEKQIHLIATGQDSKGTSSASMDLTARIQPGESSASELKGDADVTVNGKLANFGGRMMTQVSDQILGQFADNFSKRLAASAESGAAQTAAAEPEVKEINGLKFAWQVLIGFIRSFFARKA
ncbi:MAG: SRPBCC family protein [Gammaproteobacteria bacterium]|nr:SRPBCC family protein [Gammaproteobacteria bacterium]MDH3534846.1 SRPBCC family protein [Gammaproteobacteria bacterium]